MFANMFLLAFMWVVVKSSEPVCSSFHFAEKTLEKMIKTEIYVDQMKSEIEHKQQSMSNTLNGIQTDVEKTMHDLKTAKEDNRDAIDEFRTQITDLSQLHAVAFHARALKETDTNDGETLIFGNTVFDKGSGYDNETGIYVTPVGGVYIFNTQLCISNSRYIYFEIASKKAPILKGCFNDDASSYSGCRMATAIAILDAKEPVWIKSGTSTSGADFWVESKVWNSFSGVLISRIN